MNNHKEITNLKSGMPIKESNQVEDFLLQSEKNRNLFLKFSENARKKIGNINFKFEEDLDKKDNAKFSDDLNKNNSFEKKNFFNFKAKKENNIGQSFENPFNNNQAKNSNSNQVFDYYSKIKNPDSISNFGVENFTKKSLSNLRNKKNSRNVSMNKSKNINNDSPKGDKTISHIQENQIRFKFSKQEKEQQDGKQNIIKNFTNKAIEENIKPLINPIDNNFDIYKNETNNLNIKPSNLKDVFVVKPALKNENENIDLGNNLIPCKNSNHLNYNFNNIKKNEGKLNENFNDQIKGKLQQDEYNKSENEPDFNAYIQKCLELNKKKNIIAYNENDDAIYNNNYANQKEFEDKNFHINLIQNKTINHFPLENRNLHIQNQNYFQEAFSEVDEQNYENFTQEFFFERYGQFFPSVMTPTSFNRDISQYLRKEKGDEKSDASSRIINIKCQPIQNKNYTLINKINQLEKSKEGNTYERSNKLPYYMFSEDEKKTLEKFDFSKLSEELEKAYIDYDSNPISINLTFNSMNEIHKSNIINFSNYSLHKWISAYNKILSNEAFIRNFKIKNFQMINPDFVSEIIIKKIIYLNNQNNSNKNETYSSLSIEPNDEILRTLNEFFMRFSIINKEKENSLNLIIQIKISKFVDSLKIFECQDFLGNDIDIAYIIPTDYYDFSNNPHNTRRKNPSDTDIIFIKNFQNSYNFENQNISFIEEKDFEIIK